MPQPVVARRCRPRVARRPWARGGRPRSLPLWAALAAAVAAAVAPAAGALAATPDQVDRSVDRGVAYLYAHQRGGNWETAAAARPGIDPPNDPNGLQYGGVTALATFALLSGGQSSSDPRIKAAVDWLERCDMKGTYAIGLRSQVWSLLPADPLVKRAMERDRDLLLHGIRVGLKGPEEIANGYFGYGQGMPPYQYDHSVSQFGVLGLSALEQGGMEVSTAAWREMDRAWRSQRQPDGAWCYLDRPIDIEGRHANLAGQGGELLSMTAAGVATLFITQDYANVAAHCDGNINDPDLAAGLAWVATHLDRIDAPGWAKAWEYYTLFGIARIGQASGYKYLGHTDWFQWGADRLLRRQDPGGSWGGGTGLLFAPGGQPVDQGVYDTSFALLFLSRGRAPVLFNKLQYDLVNNRKSAPGNWDERPRDVANLTRFIGRQSEAQLNWQIVNLAERPVDLLDAPILYVSGDQPLRLAPADVAKLKGYVEQGGLILGHADCSNIGFTNTFRKLGTEMFPGERFEPLPADSPIYAESFRRKGMSPPPAVEALANGVRVQMLLLPEGDPGRAWQTQEFPNVKRYPVGQLMIDVYLYVTDGQRLPTKGSTYLVRRDESLTAKRTVRVARLKYAGNWDPEPGGWPRVGNLLHNDHGVDLDVQPVELGSGQLTKDYALADLTGTAAFTLTEPQRKELADYVAGGGTLLVDAAGGRTPFAAAARAALVQAFPSAPNPLPVLPPGSPVYAAGGPLGPVAYRRFARAQLGKLDTPQVRGFDVNGRLAVLFSGEDLAAGMVGQPVDGIVGYAPATATAVAEHIVLFAAK